MKLSVRNVATALGIGFALYFVARSFWWTVPPQRPLLAVASTVLFFVVVVTAALIRDRRQQRMPLSWALVSVAASVAIPWLATAALRVEHRAEPYATWYIGGVGLIAVVCIARRRSALGWLSLAVVAVESSFILTPFEALALGLVGSFTWCIVAQLLVLFWDRAVRDTERLAEIQQAVSGWQATQLVRQRERRVRVQYALEIAGPLLSQAVAAHGHLTDAERAEARLAEGRLRDELRGANLLNDAVREAILKVRSRGIEVTVFDEGGLDEVDEARRALIRDELATVISRVDADRVIIRAARDADSAVTIVARSRDGGSKDEDTVVLWHVIPREAGARTRSA